MESPRNASAVGFHHARIFLPSTYGTGGSTGFPASAVRMPGVFTLPIYNMIVCTWGRKEPPITCAWGGSWGATLDVL